MLPALGARSPNHWPAGEVLVIVFPSLLLVYFFKAVSCSVWDLSPGDRVLCQFLEEQGCSCLVSGISL